MCRFYDTYTSVDLKDHWLDIVGNLGNTALIGSDLPSGAGNI